MNTMVNNVLNVYKDYITPEEEMNIINFIHNNVENYESVGDRHVLQFGIQWKHGEILPAIRGIPDFIQRLVPNANQCLVNIYPSNTFISYHIDDTRLGSAIHVLSCCADTKLELVCGNETVQYLIPRRSMYVLENELRYNYLHRTLPTNTERISLTFRCINNNEF